MRRRCIPGCSGGFLAKGKDQLISFSLPDEHLHLQYLSKSVEKRAGQEKKLSNEEKDSAESIDMEKPEREKNYSRVPGTIGRNVPQILMYYYFDDMSMQEIADKLGFANTDTAKTKKYKCKQKLDELVKAQYSEQGLFRLSW